MEGRGFRQTLADDLDHDDIEPVRSMRPQRSQSCWDPIVLSLDGGGMRGLSSLLILQKIMEKVAEYHQDEEMNRSLVETRKVKEIDRTTQKEKLVEKRIFRAAKPCHYFDLMIGASTGGLIAIMLGRLRMDIQKAIDRYIMLGQEIFGHQNIFWPRYDHRRFEKVLKEVVENHTWDDGGADTKFKQQDPQKKSCCKCRTAVVSQKRMAYNKTGFLLRSYDNFPDADDDSPTPLSNPGYASNAPIWNVARATTAAPLFFKKAEIDGEKYEDGGVGDNNPVYLAYGEAMSISNSPKKRNSLVLSIGTGQKGPAARFGSLITRIKFLKWSLTETESAHLKMLDEAASRPDLRYHRLNVESGLDRLGIDEWVLRMKPEQQRRAERDRLTQTPRPPVKRYKAVHPVEIYRKARLKKHLRLSPERLSLDHPFDTHLIYETKELIEKETTKYIRSNWELIEKCAGDLVELARKRKETEPMRYNAMRHERRDEIDARAHIVAETHDAARIAEAYDDQEANIRRGFRAKVKNVFSRPKANGAA